jgi:soluble lytic murein transglycosylase-like protein
LACKANFNRAEPRVPAGSPGGGRWTDGGGDTGYVRVAANDRNGTATDASPPIDKTLRMPTAERKAARRAMVVAGKGGLFLVEPNPIADSGAPLREIPQLSAVNKNDSLIVQTAKLTAVDPDLIRSIIYMETTHGYYDFPAAILGLNQSILPMNVNLNFWGGALNLSRADLADPRKNIQTGAKILKGIIGNVPHKSSIAVIATLYNDLGAKKVSDYGARVEAIYKEKAWKTRQ